MFERLSPNPTLHTPRTDDLAARLAALIGPAVTAATRLARAIRGRRAAYRLAALDDHMLSDIGLTRFDVDSALAMPLASDPNAELIRRRSDRIASQRRGRKFL
ncbi:DUF1127 domain-containing protein [Afifella sp. IM 167]|uniref:DUF1127 domain-containing protein n=1 Tax=Afifella sp. IM 167 TaxID=2033586 RepID=UPI001CD0243D|nr:DUF1127 domain-containing protein [Afifella sp. IM 167]MBZ8132830.1 hypothetical protein [Afifella sp. IM 167]